MTKSVTFTCVPRIFRERLVTATSPEIEDVREVSGGAPDLNGDAACSTHRGYIRPDRMAAASQDEDAQPIVIQPA